MKAQFFDGFNFDKYKFSIVAVEYPENFFNITDFGLNPGLQDESCIRGYTGIFTVNDDKRLCLISLLTNNNNLSAPAIDGIEPHKFHSPAGNLKYELSHVMDYTGRIVIANKFVQKFYVPFGFQLPHAFEKVYELTFDKGLFLHVEDLSTAARVLRDNFETPIGAKDRIKNRVGTRWMHKSEDYGYDDALIEQYMDISYETKYLFDQIK